MLQNELSHETMVCFEQMSKVIAESFRLPKKSPKAGHHYQELFNFSEEEIARILDIVFERIPYSIYLEENKVVKDAIAPIIAQELVMFLARENGKSKDFNNNLSNFRDEIASKIINDVYIK